MGRRLSDDFPYIGYVRAPAAVTALDYDEDSDILSLTRSNGTVISTEIFVPSEYVYKMSGDWALEGVRVPAYPSRALSASFSGSGPFTMSPASTVPSIGSACIVATDDSISTTGTGIAWSRITVPSISTGDNLYRYTAHLGSSNSALLDQLILLAGGVPSNSVWGAYVTFDGTGFSSFSVIGSTITNNITHVFSTTPVAGDSIYVGIDYDNGKIVVQHNSGPVIDASPITLTNMPASETFFWGLSMQFTSNIPVFSAGTMFFEPGTSDYGKAPITVESSATPPIDAEEGKQYRVTSPGNYNGYKLLVGDFITFYNGIDDVIINRLGNPEFPQIPPGVSDLTYDIQAEQLVLERIYSDGSIDHLTAQIPLRSGIVIIEDVTPASGSDNVSNKVFSDDGFVLQSCLSNTTQVNVQVLGNTGSSSFKPSITVNGVSATIARISPLSDLWRGVIPLTLSGTPPYTIKAVHSEGSVDTCVVNAEVTPTVTNAYFSDAYSQGAGQTKHAQGQTLYLTVESAEPFRAIDVVSGSGNALTAGITNFSATTSKSITVSVADRGNVDTVLPALIRIQNTNGTWSAQYSTSSFSTVDGVGTLVLNNTRPTATLGAVTYPIGQSALKDTESASVPVTYLNVDEVIFSSPGTSAQLLIADPTTIEPSKIVSRISGSAGYNISADNLTAVVKKVSNATTSSASRVVNIAHDPATITSISKPSRLRSSPTGINHTITVTCSQRTQSLSMSASIGDLQGTSWGSLDQGLTYTRQLRIDDADSKEGATFTPVSLVNLAGVVTTEASISDTIRAYTVGGFTQRTIYVNVWVNGSTASQREAILGTQIRDLSKLVVTIGSSVGVNTQNLATYTSPSNPATTNYAVTGPSGVLSTNGVDGYLQSPANRIYVRDTLLASGNTAEQTIGTGIGTLPVIIEELI